MKHTLYTLAVCGLVLCGCSSSSERTPSLSQMQKQFQNPPESSRPYVWWHWMNGNVTKDGIKKDLEWMKRAGIGGFHHFDASQSTPQIVKERLIYMHDDWKEAFGYAAHVADSLGLDMAIASSPGWSCMGGPWVEPQDGMKKLVWRELDIQGGKNITLPLPEPYKTTGTFQNRPLAGDHPEYYKDIAVIAVKTPDCDRSLMELSPSVTTNSGTASLSDLVDGDMTTSVTIPVNKDGEVWISYKFPTEQTFCAVSVADGRSRNQWANAEADVNTLLECSNDGKNYSLVTTVPSSWNAQQTVAFQSPVTAKYFRLHIVTDNKDDGMGGFLAALGYGRTAPKSKTVTEFKLYTSPRVNHAEEKAVFAAPHDLGMYPTADLNMDCISSVINVTDKVKDGVLSWDAPEGRWRIYRFGYSLTGKHNSPAPAEATGLEVDKLDHDAWSRYFHTYFDMYVDASGGLIGKHGVRNLLTDSYEAEQENWTDALPAIFKERRGYDLYAWMPALAGEIINSTAETERFLTDFRKTLSELLAESYDMLNDFVKEYGMLGRYSEAHENGRVYCVDGMDVKRTAMVPMSAIWMPTPIAAGSSIPMATADLRESASVAHIYGQNIAAAESMTAIGMFQQAYSYCPENLKPIVDLEFANGINRIIVHESAHQPLDEKFPGLSLGVTGQWFNRHETWAEYARPWTDYIARSSYMLKLGNYHADILYYYGEDSNITAMYGNNLPNVPRGYAFDFASPSVLKKELSVKNGKIVTNSGMSYSMLVLDKNCYNMSVENLEAIKSLCDNGAVIVGSAPAVMSDNYGTIDQFNNLVKDIFQSSRKNVFANIDQAIVGVTPDWICDHKVNVVHRDLGKSQIWWVSNPTDVASSIDISLNVTGMKPSVFNPITGKVSDVSYRMEGGRTVVTLDMDPNDALFIVFGKKSSKKSNTVEPIKTNDIQTLNDGWTVSFQSGRGAPEKATMSVGSFVESADEGIRHFSGTATYSKVVNVDNVGSGIILDLGSVKNIAEVIVNGKSVGTLWKEPFTIDITKAIKTGENTIELKVTNLWQNRLIGDAALAPEERITFTAEKYYQASDNLKPSGLIGPVKLMEIVK